MSDPSDSATDDVPAGALDGGDQPTPGDSNAARSPALPNSTIWGEVCAVLAIGVFPHILFAGISLRVPLSPILPYWLDAVQLTVLSGCTIFVTMYLIHRSGEPWGRFGMPRPSLWDLLLGLGVFVAAEFLWWFGCGLVAWDSWGTYDYPFSRPQRPVEYPLMVLKYGASAFSEELVTRAYLVTRFEQLLRSRGIAVLVAAALFAAYHGYQGPAGLAYTMALGVMYGGAFLLLRRVWPLAIGHALYNIRLELAA